MTEELSPQQFYERTIQGTDNYQTITLERRDGALLPGVEMHVVSKGTLAEVIRAMPDEMQQAVDEDEIEDLSPEEAREIAEESGTTAQISPELVDAFKDMCKESLHHEGLADKKMEYIIDDFGFNMFFEVGGEILNFSVEEGGDIRGFQKQP